MKKLLFALLVAIIMTCLFAIGVSAARVENYKDAFELRNETQIIHYYTWNYTNDAGEAKTQNRGYTDKITVTFKNEKGETITSVPLWEYDEEDGRYYSLIWYICDWQYTCSDLVIEDSTAGTQTRQVYESAIYTLTSARATDLKFYAFDSKGKLKDQESWKTTHTINGEDWAHSGESLTVLQGIYLDLNNTPDDKTDDLRLNHPRGMSRYSDGYANYGDYEGQFAAQGNKIVVANFRDCTFQRDAESNYGASNTFSGATHLQYVAYPDTMLYMNAGPGSVCEIDLGEGIEVIACQILRDNKRIKEITIPNSVLFLNNEAFRGTDLTTLTVGENLIVHGGSPFLYTGGADNVYISRKSLTTLVSNINALVANNNANIYFDGSLEEAEALMADIIAENSNTYNNKITLVDYNTTKVRGDIKNVCIFYNYNRCDAFYRGVYDIVSEEGNTCSGECDKCGLFAMLENPVHVEGIKLGFGVDVDGDGEDDEIVEVLNYYANMYVLHVCVNCSSETAKADAYGSIFSAIGYSADENDSTSVSFFTAVNHKALEKYEEMAETELQYGLVVSALPSKSPITGVQDGKLQLSSATVSVSMTGTEFTKFSLKVTALPAAQSLNCCGYVVNGTSVTYLGHNATNTDAEIVTYESIITLLNGTTNGSGDNEQTEEVPAA